MTTREAIYKTALEHIRGGHDAVCTECGWMGPQEDAEYIICVSLLCPVCGNRKSIKTGHGEMATYALAQGERDVKEFLRSSIRDALAQCTEKQQEFFHEIYPKGIDGIADSSLQSALELCERTIAKNNRAAS